MRRLTKAEREHARRVAVSELVYVAELANTSKLEEIHAFGSLVLKRADRIARRRSTAKAFSERDIQRFLAWRAGNRKRSQTRIVHLLRYGKTLCQMPGTPNTWSDEHRFIIDGQPLTLVTCPTCRSRLAQKHARTR